MSAAREIVEQVAEDRNWVAYERLMGKPGVEYRIDYPTNDTERMARVEVDFDPQGNIIEVCHVWADYRIGQGWTTTDMFTVAIEALEADYFAVLPHIYVPEPMVLTPKVHPEGRQHVDLILV